MFSMFIEFIKSACDFLSSWRDFQIVDIWFLGPHIIGRYIHLFLKDARKTYQKQASV